MRDHGIEVERPRQPVDIEISEDVDELSDPSLYPVKVGFYQTAYRCFAMVLQVTVDRLDATDESKTEIIPAKFVVGADGERCVS